MISSLLTSRLKVPSPNQIVHAKSRIKCPEFALTKGYLKFIQPRLSIFSESHHIPIFVAFPATSFLENKPSHLCLSEFYKDVFFSPASRKFIKNPGDREALDANICSLSG
jgi:hypothetical protein